MSSNYDSYRAANSTIPQTTLAWNMYGQGLENVGLQDAPETLPIPEPNPDQLLVRIDTVGLCFSDVKLIRQGSRHPKLHNRDLSKQPTRLGHEVALTIVRVGAHLAGKYRVGQRVAVQPDIYQKGKSTAYGYTIPGGLIQYHLIGSELLRTDNGTCLLPLKDELGYAESAMLEPWGCVMAAYTQRRRLKPRRDGFMWIIGQPGDNRRYQFSKGLDRADTIILTDVPEDLARLVESTSAQVIVANELEPDNYADFCATLNEGLGIDDIIILAPKSAAMISEVAQHIARRGTLNLVGEEPLDGLVEVDVGRLHYDYIAFLGTSTNDISASYGPRRNRSELRPMGTAVVVGAGGPMGQMHMQRALKLPAGPKIVVATEINSERLAAVQERLGPIAEANERTLLTFNPVTAGCSLKAFISEATAGKMADDVIIIVPSAQLMAEGAGVMNDNGMLVLFAGIHNGTMAPLDLSHVYRANAQYTGTSGLTIHDQADVMARTVEGSLSPGWSVAAIGGMNVAKEGLKAMMNNRFAGKIVIFPQLTELPLLGLDELAEHLPEVARHLGSGNCWTAAAEQALLDQHWVAT